MATTMNDRNDTNDTSRNDKTVDQLNSFLRGEISAVETYRQALEKDEIAPYRMQLQESMTSHQQRVSLLRQVITARGGDPSDGSGVWGAFAKLVEGGAKLFGVKAAISALEEGEDHGLADYRRDLDDVDADARNLVLTRLLPEQERTHRALSSLKHTL